MAGPARVFISYSSKDTDIVDRLKGALSDAGVVVWLDHEQLTPGTPNWEIKVREGIAQATHIVYAASPDAALSPYVIHEIEMARGKGKTVLPFWIRGENWYDCAPMGWYRTQYTDGRGSAYTAGLTTLKTALGTISYPLPDVPTRLASLGFRGVNPKGTPAILPPLVTVAAGPFLMGSDKTHDKEARDNELSQHRVELPAFQIGKYPVTVAEYALAVHAGAVREPLSFGGIAWQTQLQRLDHPIVCVIWQDAMTYITWLRRVTGATGWRLPSEAQWEKAARWDAQRGVSRIYPWGDIFDTVRCNTAESGIRATTPVGTYPAQDAQRSGVSPRGAEDMAGNVLEWTSSVFKPYPYTVTDGREEEKSTSSRVPRGGSWSFYLGVARAAFRSDLNLPDFVVNLNGFRLVAAAPGSLY